MDINEANRCIKAVSNHLATRQESPRAAQDILDAVKTLVDTERSKVIEEVRQKITEYRKGNILKILQELERGAE